MYPFCLKPREKVSRVRDRSPWPAGILASSVPSPMPQQTPAIGRRLDTQGWSGTLRGIGTVQEHPKQLFAA